MKQAKGKRACLYSRFSDKKQEAGDSERRQLNYITGTATDLGYEIELLDSPLLEKDDKIG